MLEILQAPNTILSTPSKSVLKIDKAILRLISEMEEALESAKDPIGVGLAAPQIGKNLRIFIAKPSSKGPLNVFINPKILKKEDLKEKLPGKKARKLEGCLSLYSIWGEVKRYSEVFMSFQDEKGITHKRKFKGFMSTIVQHEVDHLEGILFTKRVLEQKGALYKSAKDEAGEDIFEELKI
jgi:peptide deformylase